MALPGRFGAFNIGGLRREANGKGGRELRHSRRLHCEKVEATLILIILLYIIYATEHCVRD